MKLIGSAAVAACVALAAGAAGAEETTLVCTGSMVEVSVESRGEGWVTHRTPTNFSFELAVDAAGQTVARNGRPMAVRKFDAQEVVFSAQKPGWLDRVSDDPVYTVSRKTGLIRFDGGSGVCAKVQTAAPLF